VLAPADGRIMDVAAVEDPFVGPATRVVIFLSPLDVHVNRAPVAGVVLEVERAPGRFVAAYRPEAGEVNARCTLRLQGEGVRVAVTQVAGVVARRIVCRAAPGDKLGAGERYGLIRFGSRTDLVAPREMEVWARVGQHVRGGETPLGVLP
jgi:phosphatidylserine decarboxylase